MTDTVPELIERLEYVSENTLSGGDKQYQWHCRKAAEALRTLTTKLEKAESKIAEFIDEESRGDHPSYADLQSQLSTQTLRITELEAENEAMVLEHGQELFRKNAEAVAQFEALAEQLECANQNMKAMNANGDKLREQLAHQWHIAQDVKPDEDGFYQTFDGQCIGWLYWQSGHGWSNEHEFEAFPTHWRYSTPPIPEDKSNV